MWNVFAAAITFGLLAICQNEASVFVLMFMGVMQSGLAIRNLLRGSK